MDLDTISNNEIKETYGNFKAVITSEIVNGDLDQGMEEKGSSDKPEIVSKIAETLINYHCDAVKDELFRTRVVFLATRYLYNCRVIIIASMEVSKAS